MIELLSEPLYILAQTRLLFGLRVIIETLAIVSKASLTLLLLYTDAAAPAIALSWAQARSYLKAICAACARYYTADITLLFVAGCLCSGHTSGVHNLLCAGAAAVGQVRSDRRRRSPAPPPSSSKRTPVSGRAGRPGRLQRPRSGSSEPANPQHAAAREEAADLSARLQGG